MENPYKPPRAYIRETGKGSTSSLYNIINNIYLVILVLFLLLLFRGNKLIFDLVTLFLLSAFISPSIAYLLVRARYRKQLHAFLYIHSTIVMGLLYIFFRNLEDMGMNQGVGYVIIAINVAALVGARHQLQRL